MTDSILKQQEIAAYFGNLLSRVRRIEKFISNENNTKANNASEASQDGNPFLNPYVFIPCQVTSIVDNNTFIGLEVFPNDDPNNPWQIASENNQAPIEITVPSNVSIPAEGDLVLAHFTGTFGSGEDITPRYGVFGSGGSITRCLVLSVNEDTLTVQTIGGSATPFEVVKPHTLRFTGWNGETVAGISYVYGSAASQTRVASQPGQDDENQLIIPPYIPNQSEVFVMAGGEAFTVGSNEVRLFDINADARAWAVEPE